MVLPAAHGQLDNFPLSTREWCLPKEPSWLDAGVPGPYRLSELRGYRFREAKYPDRERLPDEAPEYVTRGYSPGDFSAEPFVGDHHRRMVQLMLEDLDRGIALEAPPVPPPGEIPAPRAPDDDAEIELPE